MLENQWEIIKKSKIQLFLFVCLLGMHSGAFSKRVVNESCTYSSDCNLDLICKKRICTEGCRWAANCKKGKICKAGKCKIGCNVAANCPIGNICEAGTCEAGCNVAANCPIGNICKDHKCEAGCNVAANCPYGNICKDHKCVLGCNLDSNCSLGQICTAGQCVAGCKTKINCPDDKLCVDGQCKVASNVARGGECRRDANCKSGLECVGLIENRCKQKMTNLNDLKEAISFCLTKKTIDLATGADIGVAANVGACIGVGIASAMSGAYLASLMMAQGFLDPEPVTRNSATAAFITYFVSAVSNCAGASVGIAVVAALAGAVGACALDLSKEYYFVGK